MPLPQNAQRARLEKKKASRLEHVQAEAELIDRIAALVPSVPIGLCNRHHTHRPTTHENEHAQQEHRLVQRSRGGLAADGAGGHSLRQLQEHRLVQPSRGGLTADTAAGHSLRQLCARVRWLHLQSGTAPLLLRHPHKSWIGPRRRRQHPTLRCRPHQMALRLPRRLRPGAPCYPVPQQNPLARRRHASCPRRRLHFRHYDLLQISFRHPLRPLCNVNSPLQPVPPSRVPTETERDIPPPRKETTGPAFFSLSLDQQDPSAR